MAKAKPKAKKNSNLIWLPNLVTAGNLMAGFAAIAIAVDRASTGRPLADFGICAWLVVLAGGMDFLDGKLAKWTGTTSAFGMRMDSFADGVSFGLAPAVLMACTFLRSPAGSLPSGLGEAAAGLYFVCAAIRLARYNVAAGPSTKNFQGLPSPAAAATVVSFYMVSRLQPPQTWFSAVLVAGVGLLMVSTIPFVALKGKRAGELKLMVAVILALLLLLVPFGWKDIFWTMMAYVSVLGWGWVLVFRQEALPLKDERTRKSHSPA
jgi:CDP-diacylglycerol--serine O-phosphatidyltransferase